ncbi:hypothetical protein AWB80_07598 [Caballeronia pedi]|uniref:Uncharacterized protein n=1 Tax=Caballeronia pedi TaxID=1777141 RepID=A0A158DWI3_9BURK|nr:hypothetical protein AWB80_07598 [Caballeronia pedi]
MVKKVTISQHMLQPMTPVSRRQNGVRLVRDRSNRESDVGYVSVDHTKLERANSVVAGVHS